MKVVEMLVRVFPQFILVDELTSKQVDKLRVECR